MTDVRRIERYEGVFSVGELDWDNAYYVGTLDGKPYAYLHVQGAPGLEFVLLHITLFSFSRRVLRELLSDYVALKALLRIKGVKIMVHLKEPPFRSWEKLMRVLGFREPQEVRVDGKLYKTVHEEVV